MQKTTVTFEEVYTNEYISTSVSILVEKQIKKMPFLKTFQDDITQEIWLAINKAIINFDYQKNISVETFFRRVVENKIINVCRYFFNNEIKKSYLELSIDSFQVSSRLAKDYVKIINMSIDIHSAIAELPIEMQKVCALILDGNSFAEISRTLNVSQSSLYHFYIYPIRKVFFEKNLQKYLKISEDFLF